jgi:uncharacterized protein YlzI (FlbEa/FlbD family)
MKLIEILRTNGTTTYINPSNIESIDFVESIIYIKMKNGYVNKIDMYENKDIMEKLKSCKIEIL